MSDRSTDHSTFVIERTYDAPPARVFNAWADREAKDGTRKLLEGLDAELRRQLATTG